MARAPSVWDDPKSQLKLEKLAAQMLTASEIAAKFKPKLSRNAIIGRARRTGVNLQYEEKRERVQKATGEWLMRWNETPINCAYRLERQFAAQRRLYGYIAAPETVDI